MRFQLRLHRTESCTEGAARHATLHVWGRCVETGEPAAGDVTCPKQMIP